MIKNRGHFERLRSFYYWLKLESDHLLSEATAFMANNKFDLLVSLEICCFKFFWDLNIKFHFSIVSAGFNYIG